MAHNPAQTPNGEFPRRQTARWLRRPADEAVIRRFIAESSFPPLLARLLAARGFVDGAQAELFLRPALGQLDDPFGLKGMEEAVQCLGQAFKEDKPIWIYGDYDVDGITATAILLLTLKELGREAEYYIPHRISEGYGLHREAVEQLAQEGAKVIVTVDCGITANEAARRARELGIDLIVTDHHEPGAELPEACAIVNPKQDGCRYAYKGLAGAGVAFKLAHALLRRFHPDPAAAREFLKSLLDLAALGTVADIVPVMGENRAIISHGLAQLRLCKRTGLMHLFERAGLSLSQLNAGSISYIVAPRLNAAGRTKHAMYGVELLLTGDSARARELAHKLEGFNENRRDIEQATLEEALALLGPHAADPVIVVAREGWHQGVLGIVASRILSQYYRPVIVIGTDGPVARGSGRSIAGFDLHEGLRHCRGHLHHFGGHKMAAGLELATESIDTFRQAINQYARQVLSEELMCPLIMIDAEAGPEDLTLPIVRRLDEFAPHGPENPKPVVALEKYKLIEEQRVMRGRHIKLQCAGPKGQPLTALGWGMVHRLGEFAACRGPIRLAGTPIVNSFNGKTTVELELKDFRINDE